jgi:hypothetical protein
MHAVAIWIRRDGVGSFLHFHSLPRHSRHSRLALLHISQQSTIESMPLISVAVQCSAVQSRRRRRRNGLHNRLACYLEYTQNDSKGYYLKGFDQEKGLECVFHQWLAIFRLWLFFARGYTRQADRQAGRYTILSG